MSSEPIFVIGIISAVLFACGSAGLLMVRLDNPRLLGLGWLGAALGAGGAGALLLSIDPRHLPLLSILLADLLILGAFVLLNLAVMEVVAIHGVPTISLLLLAGQAAADLFLIYGQGSLQVRITLVGLLIGAQTTQTVFLLLRRAPVAVRSPARAISAVLISFIAWNLLRSMAIATGLLRNRTFAGQPLDVQVQIYTDFFYLVVALVLAFGFFWMTTARLTAMVEDLANIDPLTNVLNRRAFSRCFEEEFQRSQRFSTSFALLMLDLDHFKRVNDRYGHIVGDAVLCTAVRNMKDSTREIDLIGRWGGEEFVILLPGATADTAQRVAERIRANIDRRLPLSDPSQHVSFTASLGITTGHPDDTMEEIFRRADEALYRAKSEGRNCIRIASFESSLKRKGAYLVPERQ